MNTDGPPPFIPHHWGILAVAAVKYGEPFCAPRPSGFPRLGQHPCLDPGTLRERSVGSRIASPAYGLYPPTLGSEWQQVLKLLTPLALTRSLSSDYSCPSPCGTWKTLSPSGGWGGAVMTDSLLCHPKTPLSMQSQGFQHGHSALSTYLALDLGEGPSQPPQCMDEEVEA